LGCKGSGTTAITWSCGGAEEEVERGERGRGRSDRYFRLYLIPKSGRYRYDSLGTLIEAQIRPRPNRRMPFSRRLSDAQSGSSTPALAHANHLLPSNDSSPNSAELALKPKDLLLHSMLAPSLAVISTDDIITPQSSSLAIIPSTNGSSFAANQAKRGPRGKPEAANADLKEIPAAPGTLTALAIASGQQQPIPVRSRNAAGAQGQWVLGKSLADLKKMESASQLEVESDWARIQGGTGRGRRTRGD